MSNKYDYRDDETTVVILDPQGTEIGSVIDVESAEILVPYLDAGVGGFSIEPFVENEKREYAFVQDGSWVAYTDSETAAEALISHLNRNG